jgi:hypothetical protein
MIKSAPTASKGLFARFGSSNWPGLRHTEVVESINAEHDLSVVFQVTSRTASQRA